MTSQAVLHGSTSGTATLLAAAVSGAAVLTFPAATGTVALLADVTGGIATHAALQTGVHGISIAAGKTFTASNTLTLTATDGSTLAIGTGGTLGSAAYTASTAYEAAGGIATHAALTTGIHGLAITAGQTLTVTTGGTLGSAAYTASTAYEAAGGIATHAALTTGVHGLAITAGQTLTVTTGGTLGSAAYTASTAYEAAGGIATHAALTATHGVSGAIVGTTDAQTLTNKTITTFGGAFTFNPANLSATLSPTGTGTVTINPATAGAMNNVVIGAITPLAGTFTSLTVSATTGDSALQFSIDGANDWIVGIDNSDSDKFKVSFGTALGTNDYFTINTTGGVLYGSTGPHSFGGGISTQQQFAFNGAFTGAASAFGIVAGSILTPAVGGDAALLWVSGTLNKTGSGTHADFAAALFVPPTIGAGAATLTNSSTVKIAGAPSVGTNTYALWVDGGSVRIDGTTGAGAGAGTLSNAPSAGDPDKWIPLNSDGTQYWVPAWAA